MEYKQPTEDMKEFVERAQEWWENIDVAALQPIVHGPPVSEERMAARAEQMRKIEELNRAYVEQMRAALKAAENPEEEKKE